MIASSYCHIHSFSNGLSLLDPAGEIAETRVEGYTTDQTATVEIFAVDVDPCTGAESERQWGSSIPRATAVQGFWQFRSTDLT